MEEEGDLRSVIFLHETHNIKKALYGAFLIVWYVLPEGFNLKVAGQIMFPSRIISTG
jgi:hypothetical protein